MAADSASTTARSCLVVAGGYLRPSLPAVHALVLGEASDDSSMGLWSLAASSSADEVDQRAEPWGPTILPNKGGWPRVPLV
jgi:hypothetical protein